MNPYEAERARKVEKKNQVLDILGIGHQNYGLWRYDPYNHELDELVDSELSPVEIVQTYLENPKGTLRARMIWSRLNARMERRGLEIGFLRMGSDTIAPRSHPSYNLDASGVELLESNLDDSMSDDYVRQVQWSLPRFANLYGVSLEWLQTGVFMKLSPEVEEILARYPGSTLRLRLERCSIPFESQDQDEVAA